MTHVLSGRFGLGTHKRHAPPPPHHQLIIFPNTYYHNAPFCRRVWGGGVEISLECLPPFPYHLFWTVVHTDPDSQEPNPQSHGPCCQMFQVLSLPLLYMGIKWIRSGFLGQPTHGRVPIQCSLGLHGWVYIMDRVEWAVGLTPQPPPSNTIIITL